MKFEILTIEDIKPTGKYKHIATIIWHSSCWTPWIKSIKKQAVSEEITFTDHWFWTDTFTETTINEQLNRFLKKRDYENQIMKKLVS